MEYPSRPMGEWELYVDESGDFERDGKTVFVGGLLVRGAGRNDQMQRLRDELVDTIYPWTTYPPHACALNLPASRIGFNIFRSFRGAPTTVAETSASAASTPLSWKVATYSESYIRALVRLAVEGPESDWTPVRSRRDLVARIRDLERELSMSTATRGDHQDLRSFADTQRTRMRGFATRSPQAFVEEPDAGEAYSVALEMTVSIPAGFTPTLATAPYAVALRALLDRISTLIANHSPHSVVNVHLAERHLFRSRHPRSDLPPLSASEFKAMCVAASGSLVSLAPIACLPYDANVPPGLVLADFIINQVANTGRSRYLSVAGWCGAVGAQTGLPAGWRAPGGVWTPTLWTLNPSGGVLPEVTV